MPRTTLPLAVSPPERLILETVAASDQIPANVRKRARVVLMAGEGAKNCTIGLDVGMHRSRVLFWRRRFADSGIRGLWDTEGVLPQERIPEAVEQAIVFDCLYRPRLSGDLFREMIWDPSINWNVRNLARRHRVSPATVQRVWKKYGIRMVRPHQSDHGVDLQTLKISQDPLFGVTVYELAGLFFENVGPVLAFCSRERPFAELTLSDMSKEARIEIVRGLVARFRVLETRSFGRWTPASTRFIEFVTTLRRKPQHAGAQLHLLVARRERGAHASAAAQAILVEQPSIVIQTAPWAPGGRRWSSWVECWLETIAVWPMQVRFVESAYQMSDYLRQIPASEFLDTLIIR